MKRWLWAFLVVGGALALRSAQADGAECVGLTTMQVSPAVNAHVNSALAACGSLTTVWAKISRQKKVGGRQLEKDKPLNVAEAEANLAAALKNPSVRARLDRVAKEVDDSNARLVYEAAVLDEEGFYAARDLKIQQAQQAAK